MGARLELTLSNVPDSVNVNNNTSDVHVKLDIITNNGTWQGYGYKTSGNISVNGVQFADLAGKTVAKDTTTNLYDGNVTVLHNQDGTGVASFSASFNVNTPSTKWVYASESITMPTVPRASTLSFGNFTTSTAGRITINRASTSFTHVIGVQFGTATGNIQPDADQSGAWWTPSDDLLLQIPDRNNGMGTFSITTYLNGNQIGDTQYANYTLYANPNVKPTITSMTVSPVNDNSWINSQGIYVKGYSKAHVEILGGSQYGAQVQSVQITGDLGTSQFSSWTSGVISTKGNKSIKATLTDTRGAVSDPVERSISVYDYFAPTITASSAVREGTSVKVKLSANYSTLDNGNTLTLSERHRQMGTTTWSSPVSLQSGVEKTLDGTFDVTKSYEVELKASDSVGNSKVILVTVPTDEVTFHLAQGGKGVAVGKYSEQDAFECQMDAEFYGNINGHIAPKTDENGCMYFDLPNGEKEWINPPNNLGFEYRTVERQYGNPVYYKPFYTDIDWQNSGTKAVNHGISGFKTTVSAEACILGVDNSLYVLPSHLNNAYLAIQTVSSTSVNFSCIVDQSVKWRGQLYITLKYTKNS